MLFFFQKKKQKTKKACILQDKRTIDNAQIEAKIKVFRLVLFYTFCIKVIKICLHVINYTLMQKV